MARKLSVRIIAFDHWPAADRLAWSRARTKGNVLDEQGELSNITDAQLSRFRLVYGSWLGHLADNEGLRFIESGVDCLSKEYLSGFLQLLETHVAPCTARNHLYRTFLELRKSAKFV